MKILAIGHGRDDLTALKAAISDGLPEAGFMTARNGSEGLEAARAEDPDVILLDIASKKPGACSICRKLKEDDRLRSIPVIFLTPPGTDRESRRKAIQAGAEGFLRRPFDEVELTALLRAIARIKAADRLQPPVEEQLQALVTERTRDLEQELAVRKRAEERLGESASHLRVLLESTADGILAVTSEGKVLWSNTRFAEIWRIPEKLRQSEDDAGLLEFIRPQLADPDAFIMKVRDLYQTDEIGIDEVEFKDGRVLERYSCPLMREGRNTGRLWSFRDITTRRQAEEALRTSERRYRDLIDSLPIGLYRNTPGPSGHFIMANAALARLLGFDSIEEVISRDVSALYADPSQRDVISTELMEKGLVLDREVDLKRKDGTSFPAAITAHAVRDADGNVGYFDGSVVDISLRRKVERESEERHKRLLSIFDGIDEPIYVSDPESHEVLYINQTSRMTWGDPGDRRCFEYLQNRDRPCPFCTNEKIFGEWQGRSYVWEFRNEINHHWYRCIDKAIPWPDGRSVRYEMAVDITDRKQAEEEREKLESELRQSQKIEAIGRLAGGVAHDFNNMLQVINTYAQLAMTGLEPSDPLYSQIGEISKAGCRSAELVQQLLAFARKQTIAPRILDLNDTVSAMLKMLGRMIGENIELVWLPGGDLWSTRVDPTQIDQVLINLVINSRDAISTVGRVTIETENAVLDEASCSDRMGYVPGEYVLLTVSDNGCGMDRDVLDKLFEPFYTTKEMGKGTGLGLSTVYGIVKQNNGIINVCSEPGVGTTFRIYLPRHAPKPEEFWRGSQAASSMRGQETILLVEDEPAILKLTAIMLEYQGYTVLTASTPGEAIRRCTEHAREIQLLMTDVVMPEMTGLDLARNLASIRPDIRHLFISGYTADIIAPHGVLDDGVHFIQKPFSMEDLAAKVREVLDGA